MKNARKSQKFNALFCAKLSNSPKHKNGRTTIR